MHYINEWGHFYRDHLDISLILSLFTHYLLTSHLDSKIKLVLLKTEKNTKASIEEYNFHV